MACDKAPNEPHTGPTASPRCNHLFIKLFFLLPLLSAIICIMCGVSVLVIALQKHMFPDFKKYNLARKEIANDHRTFTFQLGDIHVHIYFNNAELRLFYCGFQNEEVYDGS